jgi:hypothetical protein
MLIRDLKAYADAAEDDKEIGVVVYSISAAMEIAATFDVVARFDEYGALMIYVEI